MRGVIAVIPASFLKSERCYSSHSHDKDLLQKSRKIDQKPRFLPKIRKKIHDFRVRGVIVPPLPHHFRVRGVIVVIPAKKTFCRTSKNFDENLGERFRVRGVIAVFPAQNF